MTPPAAQSPTKPFAAADMAAQGYTRLADNVPVGDKLCEIWERVREDVKGWQYHLVCADAAGRAVVVDPERPFDQAPEVMELAGRLIDAGLMERKPPLSYEWAINQNLSNDYGSNFPCEELRDRAVDELFVQGNVRTDDSICTFEIFPNGDQCNDSDVDIETWPPKRGIEHMLGRQEGATPAVPRAA